MTATLATSRCPCLSGQIFADCCEPLITYAIDAPTAERLMRSRFTAFALHDAGYLLRSWHADTRPDSLELDPLHQWYRLDILSKSGGGPFDSTGTVAFTAYYRLGKERGTRSEVSRFVRESKQWFYLDGEL